MDAASRRNQRAIAELIQTIRSSNATGDLTGTNNGSIGISHYPGGTFIDNTPPALGTDSFLAVLVDKGPSPDGQDAGGASDYSDCRYFAREIIVVQPDNSTSASKPSLRINKGGFWGPAMNAAEIAMQTHSLAVYGGSSDDELNVGTVSIVTVTAMESSSEGSVGNPICVFNSEVPGMFPVRIKRNGGSDGTSSTYATWTYDLYNLKDEDYETKLNTSGAIQPEASAARVTYGSVEQASDGSTGVAYRGVTGIIKLWNVQEKAVASECEDESEINGGSP